MQEKRSKLIYGELIMKDFNTIEAVEKNTYECMEWMENRIKEVIENLMEQNEKNFYDAYDKYNKGYAEGVHDALMDVLIELEIETDEVHYNPKRL